MPHARWNQVCQLHLTVWSGPLPSGNRGSGLADCSQLHANLTIDFVAICETLCTEGLGIKEKEAIVINDFVKKAGEERGTLRSPCTVFGRNVVYA